jgi:hypothetical protein
MTRLSLLSAASLFMLAACGGGEETEPASNLEALEDAGEELDETMGGEAREAEEMADTDDALMGAEPDGECPADQYQEFVGSQLAAVTYPSDLEVRIIEPGSLYTQQYVPERMNIRVDAEGTIMRVDCG